MTVTFILFSCITAVASQYYSYYAQNAALTHVPQQPYFYSQQPTHLYQNALAHQQHHQYQQALHHYHQQLQQYHRRQQEHARNYYMQQQQQRTAAQAAPAPSPGNANYWKGLGYQSDDKGNVWLGDDLAKLSIIAKTSWP